MQSGDRTLGDMDGETDRPESIRDIQRRRREATRSRTSIEAVLSSGARRDEEEDDEEHEHDEETPVPAPAKVYVVFRGTAWNDPDGGLRESDTIVGVYASEHAARLAIVALERETPGTQDESHAWYQPYAVQD